MENPFGLVLFRINVGLFFSRVGLLCYFLFIFFKDFSFKKFWGFFFLLKSRTNNGAKFNFIGIKKIEGVPNVAPPLGS